MSVPIAATPRSPSVTPARTIGGAGLELKRLQKEDGLEALAEDAREAQEVEAEDGRAAGNAPDHGPRETLERLRCDAIHSVQ